MKISLFLTVLANLLLLIGIQQATAQGSVSVPRHVEQDVERINEFLQTHTNLDSNYNQQIEEQSRRLTEAYRKYQSARTDAERNRYHDETMYNQAQLLSTIHEHHTEIRSLANQIMPIADRLASSDINSQAIENSLQESLENSNTILEDIRMDLRRNTMIYLYADFEDGDQEIVDEMLADMTALEEQVEFDQETMETQGRNAIDQFENFSGSFLENVGTLVNQVRMMRINADRILNRVKFNATIDTQVLGTRGAKEGLNILINQLDRIAGDFPESVDKTNEVLNRSYFQLFDGIMTPRNATQNINPPERRNLSREDHERRLQNNNR